MTNLRLLTLGIMIQKSAIVKRFYEKAAIDLVIKKPTDLLPDSLKQI